MRVGRLAHSSMALLGLGALVPMPSTSPTPSPRPVVDKLRERSWADMSRTRRYRATTKARGINPKIKRLFDQMLANGVERDEALRLVRRKYGMGGAR